jgi:hypothetical protein
MAQEASTILNMSILHDSKGTELGDGAVATAAGAVAIGSDKTGDASGAAVASAAGAAQIGPGVNSTANTLKFRGMFLASILSGAGAPSVVLTAAPAHLGQIYVDTAASKVYIATGTSAVSDFKILN